MIGHTLDQIKTIIAGSIEGRKSSDRPRFEYTTSNAKRSQKRYREVKNLLKTKPNGKPQPKENKCPWTDDFIYSDTVLRIDNN